MHTSLNTDSRQIASMHKGVPSHVGAYWPIRPAPMETLQLPAALDGSLGTNRVSPRGSGDWRTDFDAIQAWLDEYMTHRATHASYHKEAERLLLWSVIQCRKPLSSLTPLDLNAYRNFLRQPDALWVSGGPRLSRRHPDWRPFARPLSEASTHQAITVIHAMFAWLVESGHIRQNPLKRQKGTAQIRKTTNYEGVPVSKT